MSSLRIILCSLLTCFVILGTNVVSSQDYPTRPIRIVTSSAGSGDDLQARLISQRISGPLGQPVIVDYKPSLAAIDYVAKEATPAGYTVILSGSNICCPERM